MTTFRRRKFLQATVALSAFPLVGIVPQNAKESIRPVTNRFKLSLNSYSFNAALNEKRITLDGLVEFCAAQGFDAVDLTGYYFPGYPAVPGNDYIYHIKRKAHQSGLAISGTGIRNDFSLPGKTARINEINLVKAWIEVAAKLGAPVLRIFSGKAMPQGYSWQAVFDWILEDIRTCVDYGKQHGVIVAVQNHNDVIKTADQVIDLIKKVNSEWCGLVLDTGSFVTNEPYAEIAKASPYAVNWQIKEKVNYEGTTQDTDLVKLFKIIHASPYRGYLPIETLSPEDPAVIVPPFLKQVREAMLKVMNE